MLADTYDVKAIVVINANSTQSVFFIIPFPFLIVSFSTIVGTSIKAMLCIQLLCHILQLLFFVLNTNGVNDGFHAVNDISSRFLHAKI